MLSMILIVIFILITALPMYLNASAFIVAVMGTVKIKTPIPISAIPVLQAGVLKLRIVMALSTLGIFALWCLIIWGLTFL